MVLHPWSLGQDPGLAVTGMWSRAPLSGRQVDIINNLSLWRYPMQYISQYQGP